MKQLVILPGGFHPFHSGHKSLYDAAMKAFPRAEVYIAASPSTETRPFPFKIKKSLAHISGVPKHRFIEVKSPFRPREITEHYDPADTVLIYVRSEKDKNTDPQPDQTKKDGEPSYFQSLKGLKKRDLQPMSKHGYMAYLPTVMFGSDMTSATEIRNKWSSLSNTQQSQLINSLYPVTAKNKKLSKNIMQIFDTLLGDSEYNAKEPTNEDVYDVLDGESCGPFDGGCYLVAKALQEIHGGKIIVLVDDKDIAQHAAVLLPDGQVIDHDGARSPKEFIKEFEKNEMVKISGVREIMPSDLPEASKKIELVPDLVDALK